MSDLLDHCFAAVEAVREAREGPYRTLLERYADGRRLCNCRCAYRTEDGSQYGHCAAGCSANQIDARYEVGRHALAEIRARLVVADPPDNNPDRNL